MSPSVLESDVHQQTAAEESRRPVSVVVADILTERFSDVVSRLTPAAEKWEADPEHVHALRVACRRAVVAIDLFKKLLPRKPARGVRRLLQDIRRATDAARDYDVLIARWESELPTPAGVALFERVRAERSAAQIPIQEFDLDEQNTGSLERQLAELIPLVRWGRRGVKGKEPRFDRFARRQLRKPVKRFLKMSQSDLSSAEALHRLRVKGKQLRYSLELSVGAAPGKLLDRVRSRLSRLQDKLGAVNDPAAGLELLQHCTDVIAVGSEAAEVSSFLNQQAQVADAARETFFKWWTPKRQRVLRKSCRQLRLG